MPKGHAFSDKLMCLKSGMLVRRGSALTSLSPFIDQHGLIRVGGRLANASLQYNQRHPIVLPSRDLVSQLIFCYEHRCLLHPGLHTLLSHISIKYWALRGRIIAKLTVCKCLQCFQAQPKFSSPFMALLLGVRVNVGRVFSQTGVDYCGPIMIKSGRRKVSPTKGYLCVFVCMVTCAVHLEWYLHFQQKIFLPPSRVSWLAEASVLNCLAIMERTLWALIACCELSSENTVKVNSSMII